MEKKEKVKSTRYVDGEAVDAVDDEVPSQTCTALDTMTYPRIALAASNMPTMKDPYMCSDPSNTLAVFPPLTPSLLNIRTTIGKTSCTRLP